MGPPSSRAFPLPVMTKTSRLPDLCAAMMKRNRAGWATIEGHTMQINTPFGFQLSTAHLIKGPTIHLHWRGAHLVCDGWHFLNTRCRTLLGLRRAHERFNELLRFGAVTTCGSRGMVFVAHQGGQSVCLICNLTPTAPVHLVASVWS